MLLLCAVVIRAGQSVSLHISLSRDWESLLSGLSKIQRRFLIVFPTNPVHVHGSIRLSEGQKWKVLRLVGRRREKEWTQFENSLLR